MAQSFGSEFGSRQSPVRGGLAQFFVEHRGAGWLALLSVILAGWFSFTSLPQQEDPTFPRHDALVVTAWPGAPPREVEQFVTDQIEDSLLEFSAIEEVKSESRANFSVVYVRLRSQKADQIAQHWDEVRVRLNQLVLPDGCRVPELDTDFQATATLLIALIAPTNSWSDLASTAEDLKRGLRTVSAVGRVRLFGSVAEQIELRFQPLDLAMNSVTPGQIRDAVLEHNTVSVPGTVEKDGRQKPVQIFPPKALEAELRELPLTSDEQTGLKLGDVVDVQRVCDDSAGPRIETLDRREDGRLARGYSVVLAIEMKSGGMIGRFKQDVMKVVESWPLPAGMRAVTISDQPAATDVRIHQFTTCFVEAVIVVLAVCLALMNWRSAVVVAVAVPLTLSMTFAGMAILGVPLQQISIAALIISLGMLVDDPVLAADGINRELAEGRSRSVASWLGPWRLRRAILFGTIINIVAFLPIVLLPGDMGAFIIALPVVVTLALAASRLVSVTFVPLLGYYLLRSQCGLERGGEIRPGWVLGSIDRMLSRLAAAYRFSLEWSLRQPVSVLVLAYGLLAASLTLVPLIGQQFFPSAERHQCLVDLYLPEGTSIRETERVCNQVTGFLQEETGIVSAAIFQGGTAPNFYYNVLPRNPGPNVAQILINTRRAEEIPALVARLRTKVDKDITQATCVVRQLDQGPALEAPIMVRVTGPDLVKLRDLADQIRKILLRSGGYQPCDDLGERVPGITIIPKLDALNTAGTTSSQLARAVQLALGGLPLAQVRDQGRLLPLVLRPDTSESLTSEDLRDLPVPCADGSFVPLHQVSEVGESNDFAVHPHMAGERAVTVRSWSPADRLPSSILQEARPQIDSLELPAGYSIEYAGEFKELNQSRREMQKVLQISLLLIGIALVVQFHSVAKASVVMLTVPLGLVGAFFGLAVTRSSFGFMALLGIVSLAGVIVSHIIVLSDFIEEARARGMNLKAALMQAGLARMRAVLTTVLATVCGLIPLALQGGDLWRPLTAVHIFGLLIATLLTLIVLPVWYLVLADRLRWIR